MPIIPTDTEAKEDNGRCWIGGCPDTIENDRIGQKGENK